MANVLLEGAATGRPLITTNIPGCREVVEDGVNGFLCESKNEQSLYTTILNMLNANYVERENMGRQSRKLIEKKFDRHVIIQKYFDDIKSL
jgi:galacturonosyltransferase